MAKAALDPVTADARAFLASVRGVHDRLREWGLAIGLIRRRHWLGRLFFRLGADMRWLHGNTVGAFKEGWGD